MIGWLRSNSLNGGIAALGNVPVADLLLILLGMPAFAAIVGGSSPVASPRRWPTRRSSENAPQRAAQCSLTSLENAGR